MPFRTAERARRSDLDAVARTSIRWCPSREAVTTVLVGADTADELERTLEVVIEPDSTDEDEARLRALRSTATGHVPRLAFSIVSPGGAVGRSPVSGDGGRERLKPFSVRESNDGA